MKGWEVILRSLRRGILIATGCILSLSLIGCITSHYQRFYFAAADLDETYPELKFYRITIRGKARNVQADLHTGWYDVATLQDLYGQAPQWKDRPKDRAPEGAGQYQLIYDPASQSWSFVDNNKRFTVIYGADASALAGQARLFGESQQNAQGFERLFAAVAGGQAHIQAIEDEQEAADLRAQVSSTAKNLNALAAKIESDDSLTTTPLALRKTLLQAAQMGANAIGAGHVFDTTDPEKGFAQAEAYYTAAKAGN